MRMDGWMALSIVLIKTRARPSPDDDASVAMIV